MIRDIEVGLATCPQAALAEYPQLLNALTGIPDDAHLLCGMELGYEDASAPINDDRTGRKSVYIFTRFYGDIMQLQAFLEQVKTRPDSIEFDDTMAVIDANYTFTPTTFSNGDIQNEAGQNNGSCKILAFGQLHGLSVDETLACFGKFYREDVLGDPDGDGHQNIRNFMQKGWNQVKFHGVALTPN